MDLAAKIWNHLARAGSVPFPTAGGRVPNCSPTRILDAAHVARLRLAIVSSRWPQRLEGRSISRPPYHVFGPSTRNLRTANATRAGARRLALQVDLSIPVKGNAGRCGLAWRAADARPRKPCSVRSPLAPAKPQATPIEERSVEFDTPAACSLVRVSLSYRRAPGTTRLEGSVVMREVILQPRPQLPTRAHG